MAKIVVDTPTREGLGFQDYAEALVNIILDSGSPFTIGILGELGCWQDEPDANDVCEAQRAI